MKILGWDSPFMVVLYKGKPYGVTVKQLKNDTLDFTQIYV